MEKHYRIRFFIDERQGNKIIYRKIAKGIYEIDEKSLKMALLKFQSDITNIYDKDRIFIGVAYVICDDVVMDGSYKFRVINSSDILRENFYC